MAGKLALIESAVSRLDQYQRGHKRVAFVYAVIKKYSDDQTGRRAALFAYYVFLSLFPLLLVLTSVLKLVLHNNTSLSNQIIHGATTYFPVVGQDLQQTVHGLGKTGVALTLGIVLTLYGARGVADVLRSSLDHIWEIPYAKRSTFPRSLIKSMGIIVVGGGGLLLAPVLSGYALGYSHGAPFRLLALLLTLVILYWVLIYVIKTGSSLPRPLAHVWLGAAIAAMGLEILQAVGGYIVARELRHLNTLYGTFAIVLGLLYWIYLQSQVLFYALEIDSVRILKLWPRSIRAPLTKGDHDAYRIYGGRSIFYDDAPNVELE